MKKSLESMPFIKKVKKVGLVAGIIAAGIATTGCGENQKDVDKKPVSDGKKVERVIEKEDYSGLAGLPQEIVIGATEEQRKEWRTNKEKDEKK